MTADPHLDTAAFALHAVPADELTEVGDHLDSCESCSAELSGFLETAALLGSAAAEVPPASLRQSIMSRIAVTAQLPPLTGSSPGRPAAQDSEPPSSVPEPPIAPGPRAGETSGRPRGRHAADDNSDGEVVRLEWYRRPAALIAAAVAAVVIGAGTIVAVNRTGDDNQAATPEQCIAQAADRTQITPAKGNGTVSYAPSCGAALVDVTGLRALPSDRTYQLWAIAGDQPRSLGVLPEASAGQQQIVAAQTKAGENVVAITEEPAGGSRQPTLPILWQATLAS